MFNYILYYLLCTIIKYSTAQLKYCYSPHFTNEGKEAGRGWIKHEMKYPKKSGLRW